MKTIVVIRDLQCITINIMMINEHLICFDEVREMCVLLNRLCRKVVDALSLEMFKASLYGSLNQPFNGSVMKECGKLCMIYVFM